MSISKKNCSETSIFAEINLRFKDEQKNAAINVERLIAGEEIRKARKKYVNANQKLNKIALQYQLNEVHKYLRNCTNNVHLS